VWAWRDSRFLRTVTQDRVLRGSCDNLFTPRPLGPLNDIARTLRGELLRQPIEEASRPVIFGPLLDSLAAAPAVVVIEDIHWADDCRAPAGRRTVGDRQAPLLARARGDERPDGFELAEPWKRV